MGRGDRKTRKGKTAIRSYGNARPHTAASSPAKSVVKKTAAHKAAAAKKVAPAKKAAPTVKKIAVKKTAPAKKAAGSKDS